MDKLSCYILTKNSEKYLANILEQISNISDEIIIIDSGSLDKTEEIAKQFSVKFIFNEFNNFKSQREFAISKCKYDFVLCFDDDEIPNQKLIDSIKTEKELGFRFDAYRIARYWNVLGQDVKVIYPIISPDFPIRLYNQTILSFANSNIIHETPSGQRNEAVLDGLIRHITFETSSELESKLETYSEIASQDIINRGKKSNIFKIIFSPISAFIKWYFIKGGFRDGLIGLKLAFYSFNYSLKKYQKARFKIANN